MKNYRLLIPVLLVFAVAVTALLGGMLSGCKPNGTSAKTIPGPSKVAVEEVTVYFSKSRGSTAVTEGVVRSRPEVATGQPEAVEDVQFAVEELLRGPNQEESKQGFYSEIPKGTRLIDVKQGTDQALNVNLSSQFTSGGGANSVQQRVQELTKTIFATVPEHQKVYVMVDGKPLELVSGEGLEIKQPLEQAIQ